MISKQLLNLFGTHLTCAQLALNNIIPVVTSRNTKGVDLIAVSADGQKSVPIQVKTTQKKRAKYWPFGDKEFDEPPRSPFFYVLVRPVGEDFKNGADFFVVPNRVVYERAGPPHRRWKRQQRKKKRKDSGVPHFELRSRDKGKYLNRWDILGLS